MSVANSSDTMASSKDKPDKVHQVKSIMLLDLDGVEIVHHLYRPFFNTLQARHELRQVSSIDDAIHQLVFDPPTTVLIVEPTLINQNHELPRAQELIRHLVVFAQTGGTVIFACSVMMALAEKTQTFFSDFWNLPWKSGKYLRTGYAVNADAQVRIPCDLPSTYSSMAQCLRDVDIQHLIYVSTPIEQHDFFDGAVVLENEGPLVLSRYGEGFVAWVGDGGFCGLPSVVLLGMCELESDGHAVM